MAPYIGRSAPSLHRESTDSLIIIAQYNIVAYVRIMQNAHNWPTSYIRNKSYGF